MYIFFAIVFVYIAIIPNKTKNVQTWDIAKIKPEHYFTKIYKRFFLDHWLYTFVWMGIVVILQHVLFKLVEDRLRMDIAQVPFLKCSRNHFQSNLHFFIILCSFGTLGGKVRGRYLKNIYPSSSLVINQENTTLLSALQLQWHAPWTIFYNDRKWRSGEKFTFSKVNVTYWTKEQPRKKCANFTSRQWSRASEWHSVFQWSKQSLFPLTSSFACIYMRLVLH